MKKVLVATTALVSALVVAQAASAAEAPTLKVGMDMRFWAFMTNDDSVGLEDREFRVDARLPITVSAKTDSGLTYGGYIRLRTNVAPAKDNSLPNTGGSRSDFWADYGFIHVGGAFGKVEFGDNDGPMTVMYVAAPFVGIGQTFEAGNGIPSAIAPFGGLGNYSFGSRVFLDQSSRVNYYTPVFSGFQAAIGFAPENGSRGLNTFLGTNATGSVENAIEAAATWTGKFDPASIKVGAGYTTGSARVPVGVTRPDMNIWQAGAQVSFGAFTVGGAYFDNGDTFNIGRGISAAAFVPGAIPSVDDETGWNFGVSWKQGPLGVAASYAKVSTEFTATTGLSDADDTVYGIGVNYVLAPGLHLDADLLFFDLENVNPAGSAPAAVAAAAAAGRSAIGNEGNTLVVRTRLLL